VKIDAGDLIYIPSQVMVYQLSGEEINSSHISAHKKIKRPTNALVTRVEPKCYEVYLDGEYWLVGKKNVYTNTGE